MKRFELKQKTINCACRLLRTALKNCLLLTAYCLLLTACQSRGREATADALTAPINTPTPAPPAPAPSIDPNVTDLEKVKEGTPAPDFALEDVNRKVYRLADYKGKKNVVLVFYRGFF